MLFSCCLLFLGVLEKLVKMELPNGGVDMQSDRACACFVRVGRCRLGSILGSILESFWEPSSPLYSFLVALVAKTAPKEVPVFEDRFCVDFRCEPPTRGRGRRREPLPSGGMVKRHLANKMMINTW